MNSKNWHICRKVVALLMLLCLMAGCTRSEAPSGSLTYPETNIAVPDYEAYKQEALTAQTEFDNLTQQLFHEYVTASSLMLQYTLADPSAYGITDCSPSYGDFSMETIKADTQQTKETKDTLANIPVNLLTEDQQLTYRILEEYCDTQIAFEGLELYYQPFSPTTGVQAQLPVLLAEYPFYNKENIEDYLSLLSQTDEYFSQLLAFEKEKSEAGFFMSDACLEEVLDSCQGYLLPPERSFLSETFTERLAALPDLTEEEITNYTARNLSILEDDFIPAYQLLIDDLSELAGTGTNDKGLYYYPKGKDYYEYLIRSSIGTTYESIDELTEAVVDQMDIDLIMASKVLKKNPDLVSQLTSYEFPKDEPEHILDSLIEQTKIDFPELPQCSYSIKYVPSALENALSPAFYLTPPLDLYENNTIYINQAYASDTDLFPTLAHEGYPGHLYQTVYFTANCTENLRHLMVFSGYDEGWAAYVENYSYTLDNGIDSDLSQFLAYNASCNLGLHALLDLYVNYYGWTKEQVAEYLDNYYGLGDESVVNSIYTAVIGNPANYLNYYVGYLEILQMRNTAQKVLGDKFQLKEFHTFLLDIGSAPFTVIEPYFRTWLLTYDL